MATSRWAMGVCAALSLLLPGPCRAAPISHGPREVGVEVLEELVLREGRILIRVGSNGTTDKGSIRPTVRQEKGLTDRSPHFTVTFERVRADEGKAIASEGVLLEYDVEEDLGISGFYTLTVTNWVAPRSEDAIQTLLARRKELIGATVQAIELELQGTEKKLEAARNGLGPPSNVETFTKAVGKLREERETFRRMRPADYPPTALRDPLPGDALLGGDPGPIAPARKQTVTLLAEGGCDVGSILNVEGMTRSGPFFHVAGISPQARAGRRPGQRQRAVLHLVYKRAYFGRIPSYYVFLAEVK